MSQSFEDILSGNGAAKSAPAQVEAQPSPPETEEDAPALDVSTEPGETEEPSSPATPPVANVVEDSLDKKISAFQRKAEDETRKRQDYERKFQEAQKAIEERDAYIRQAQEHLKQLQAPRQQQADVDLYDPEVLQQYVSGIVSQERNTWQQEIVNNKIVMSQEIMRDKHADYAEHEQFFADEMLKAEAAGDFSLRQRMEADLLPAKFVYDYAKRVKALQEIGPDPVSYKERIIQEYLASQGQAPATEQPVPPTVQTQARPVPQPPKSLAGMPSAARNVNKQPWKGPTPLEQLLS